MAWQEKWFLSPFDFVVFFASLVLQVCSVVGSGDVDLNSCGSCEREYIEALREADTRFSDRVETFLCSPPGNQTLYDDNIVFCPAPGTTATKALSRFLYDNCRMNLFHFANFRLGGEEAAAAASGGPHHVRLKVRAGHKESRLLSPETEAMKWADYGAADQFLAAADLRAHLVPPQREAPVDAVLDDPMANLFFDLFHRFPNACYIMTHRAPDEWARSRRQHHPTTAVPVLRGLASWRTADLPLATVARTWAALDAYVRCRVPPDRLLVVDYFATDTETSAAAVATAVIAVAGDDAAREAAAEAAKNHTAAVNAQVATFLARHGRECRPPGPRPPSRSRHQPS